MAEVSGVAPPTGEEAPGPSEEGLDDESNDDLQQEGKCIEEILYCLLDAKGSTLSTSSVQVAINTSVIQLAKANFSLVVTSIFAFLGNGQSSEGHQLWLLRLLCQVLETRRSDGDGRANSCTIDRTVARDLAHHLVREVAKLGQEDSRQQAISDVLVELAPMHADLVLSGVLTMLDNCGSVTLAPPALVTVLTEIAYTRPHVLDGRIHEVMGRHLPLLQTCKSPEMKLLLFRAWCSLCVALVNCAVREPSDPLSATESAFSQSFGAAALELRRRRSAATAGGGTPGSAAGRARAEESDDKRRAQQALSNAFTVLMSSWQSSKDLNIRNGAMETLGHLSLVIPKDQFLTNADSLLELLVNLLTRQSSAGPALPPLRLMRGLCLFLQSCIDADPEILLLEHTLQTLTSTMFSWTVHSGPLHYLQGSLGTDALQSQAEVLRCFDVLAEAFRKEVLGFLLQKVKGSREEKLGALLILRHLIGSASWRPRAASVVEGIQSLAQESDPAVGLLLSELIVALNGADMLTVAEGGERADDSPRPEHIHTLLSFLICQTALTQSTDSDQASSYMAKLVTKSSFPADGPTIGEVRDRAGLVLGQLAGSLKPPVRLVLWPMLLQTLVNPAMRTGLPVLCRAVAQIATCAKATQEGPAQACAELAQAFRPGHERSTQPEALLMWLLICVHSPHEPPGSGLSILRCLEALSPLLHRVLGEIWEAPSKRLQTLCTYLEDGGSNDAAFWSAALSQEMHFFLSALPEHDDLPARLADILGSLHAEVWRKDRDAYDLSAVQRAALFHLTGVCLSHVGQATKVQTSLDFILSHSSDLITDSVVRRACARGLGIVAQRHFDLVLGALKRAAKTDAATRRAGSIAQSLFGKSTAVQQAEYLRAMLALALGYCSVYAPSPELLQEQVCENVLGPLQTSLTQEQCTLVLHGVVEAVKLASDAIRMSPETAAQRDPFLAKAEPERTELALSQDPALRAALGLQREKLVRALLPFTDTPSEQEEEQRSAAFEELVCPALDAMSSLISLPLDLPSDLYASVLENSLHVMILSIPNHTSPLRQDDFLQTVDPVLLGRIHSVTQLVKSLLFHAHSWLGVSRLLQAVHAAGASCPVEFIRWTCTQLLGVLCRAAPILRAPEEGEELSSDVGDWCESLALLLPRLGDSCKTVVAVAIDAVQQLLLRCQWTADVRIGELDDAPADTAPTSRAARVSEKPMAERGEGGDPAPPSQQLVGALVARLPAPAIPPLVQHLMPAMHDADSHAAMSGVDALYLILQACCEKLSPERATNLISTVFEEVEKVSHSSVRQLVLSCIKVLALHHFESAVQELLDTGPEFNISILGALQVLAKEKALLLRLLNHFTDTLNNTDPGTVKRPNRIVQAATVALGHLFTVNDSSIGAVVKRYFSQLFSTFLLRIGTTTDGLSAQQTAAAFMNFLHASQNDSMVMALEGNRLSSVTRDQYDEVICDLVVIFCRHHPTKRSAVLQFIHPFFMRPFPGHRVATITTLSQMLLSGLDGGLGSEAVLGVVQSLLQATTDTHSVVRKQGSRGLAHFVQLWEQQVIPEVVQDEDLVLRQVLPAVCIALSDTSAAVQREAVGAVQRACQVEGLPKEGQQLLLRSSHHLQPLVDSSDSSLRAASLELLGRLCALAVSVVEEEESPTGSIISDALDGDFAANLQLLLIHCVVRLQDTCPAVAAAAGRCLQQVVATALWHARPAATHSSMSNAVEAGELLNRREEDRAGFEQFVFPFVKLIHRSGDPQLLAKRLEICRLYFAACSPSEGGGPALDSPEQRLSLSTCIAAGYVAAALVRTLDSATTRPSLLLCSVCRDLMDLMAVEDSEFRAQVARILGFFDILMGPRTS